MGENVLYDPTTQGLSSPHSEVEVECWGKDKPRLNMDCIWYAGNYVLDYYEEWLG